MPVKTKNSSKPKKSDETQPRWERRAADRPLEILDAALDHFISKGFAATTLDDIAATAGVSKGTIYLYFSDKEDVFRRVVEAGAAASLDDLEETIKKSKLSADKLMVETVGHVAGIVLKTKIGRLPKLIISEAGQFPSVTAYYRDSIVFRMHKLFSEIVSLGVRQGVFREVPPMEAVRTLIAPIFMMSLAQTMPGFDEKLQIDAKKQIEVSTEIWLKGMKK